MDTKEAYQSSLDVAYKIAISKGISENRAESILKGKNPVKGETSATYLTRLMELIKDEEDNIANESNSKPTKGVDFNIKPSILQTKKKEETKKTTTSSLLSKNLIFEIDGDTLEGKDLGERETLASSVQSALNILTLGSKNTHLYKSAIWTLTFSILKVIPTSSDMIKVNYDGSVIDVENINDVKENFYEYHFPMNKAVIDYNYIKLAFYGVVASSKQITIDNKSALMTRFDKWCLSNGITHIQAPSPFMDADSLLPVYYTMYNSSNWGNLFRKHVFLTSNNIPSTKPVLKSIYDASMMIMKDYKQKHLTMFDKLLRNPTEVLILPPIIKELKLWKISMEEILNEKGEEIYPYLASLGVLPKNLEQSNYPTLINSYLVMNPITNYKNNKKCDIPIKILQELVSKPLTTVQTLTNDDLEFYQSLGVSMDQANKRIEITIKKGIIDELKNENDLEDQKEKIEERINRKRKGTPLDEALRKIQA